MIAWRNRKTNIEMQGNIEDFMKPTGANPADVRGFIDFARD